MGQGGRNGARLRQPELLSMQGTLPNFLIGFPCNFDIECNELARHHIA
jgi:hypothetical protein